MNVLGTFWLARPAYIAWLQPLFIALATVNLLLLLRRAKRYRPFVLGLAGLSSILVDKWLFPDQRWLLFCGCALMVVSSLASRFGEARPLITMFNTIRKVHRHDSSRSSLHSRAAG